MGYSPFGGQPTDMRRRSDSLLIFSSFINLPFYSGIWHYLMSFLSLTLVGAVKVRNHARS